MRLGNMASSHCLSSKALLILPSCQIKRSARCFKTHPFRPALQAQKAPCAVICSASAKNGPAQLQRRSVLLSLAAAAAFVCSPSSQAAEELATFYGTASPPTSYGGYGGNADEDVKYTFEYPANWKKDVINKVQKGTQGIDGRVFNTRSKAEQAFVITFGRAGEDNKSFRLTDIESTFSGFAGADYDLQDAISDAEDKILGQREVNGQLYYDVEINSPSVHYLSTITVNRGKVYALFVKSPAKSWKQNEATLRNVISSFKTI